MCLSNILQEKATRISQPYNNTSSTLLHLIWKKEKKGGKKAVFPYLAEPELLFPQKENRNSEGGGGSSQEPCLSNPINQRFF